MTKIFMLLAVLTFLSIGINCQFNDGRETGEVFVPEFEDSNFGNFVGKEKQSVILFYYENNVNFQYLCNLIQNDDCNFLFIVFGLLQLQGRIRRVLPEIRCPA